MHFIFQKSCQKLKKLVHPYISLLIAMGPWGQRWILLKFRHFFGDGQGDETVGPFGQDAYRGWCETVEKGGRFSANYIW